MKGKLLSIIIPTYNMENYLRRCLDSLIVSDENMHLLEVLVVNDGSTDNTSSIGHEYATKYPLSFRVIDKDNGNYGSCINRGLKAITGKYVKLLDADDYYQTCHLDCFISQLKDMDADMVLTDMISVYADGSQKRKTFPFDHQTVYGVCLMEQHYFMDNMEMHCVTYKKEILDRLNYIQTEGISYTDQEWIFYPLTGVNSICYIPLDSYTYMLNRKGRTMDMDVVTRDASHYILILKRMIHFMKDNVLDSPSKEKYIKHRLSRNLREIFKLILIYQTDDQYHSHVEELEVLDSQIKKDLPSLFEESDSYVISKEIPCRFVRYWRNKKRRYPHVFLVLCQHLKNLDNLLRKKHLRG